MKKRQETRESQIQSAGKVAPLASIDAVVLYDPRDGTVMHLHHAITFEGARRGNQKRQAIEAARRLGCKVDGLKLLHVRDFVPSAHEYRVDVERQELVAMPRAYGF